MKIVNCSFPYIIVNWKNALHINFFARYNFPVKVISLSCLFLLLKEE